MIKIRLNYFPPFFPHCVALVFIVGSLELTTMNGEARGRHIGRALAGAGREEGLAALKDSDKPRLGSFGLLEAGLQDFQSPKTRQCNFGHIWVDNILYFIPDF